MCTLCKTLNASKLRKVLKASRLCQSTMWPDDADNMAAMYQSEVTAVLDRLIAFREITRILHFEGDTGFSWILIAFR